MMILRETTIPYLDGSGSEDRVSLFCFLRSPKYSDNKTDVFMAVSKDGGDTFVNFKISDDPFTPEEGISLVITPISRVQQCHKTNLGEANLANKRMDRDH